MAKTNLILISLDTLRADVAYSGRLPAVTRLMRAGTTFRNTVASAPITPISHASVFTGLQPFEHGIRHLFREQLNRGKPTLAELMKRSGYDTGAIVSCPGLHRWYELDRGFMHYDDEIPRLPDGRDPLQVNDVKIRGTALKRAPLVVERSLRWLDTHGDAPFCLFVHFFDTHWPYEPPEWFAAPGANAYEGEASYMDHYLGRLLDGLESRDLLKNTLIAAFGDHGEDLAGWYPNDHAGEQLGHPEENGHGCLLFDATIMVPLVLVNPDLVPANLDVQAQVRLVDIMPTVLDLLRIDDTAGRAGATLAEFFTGEGPHRPAYSETYYREEQATSPSGVPGLGPWTAIRLDNRYKTIVDVRTGRTAVYDLEGDPTEHTPIGGLGPFC